GTGRPLAATYVESEGTSVASVAAFYGSAGAGPVDGIAGAWGTIIPNTLVNGVRRIAQYNNSGALVGGNTDADGVWSSGANTVNPAGGTTSVIDIAAADAPLNVADTVTYNGNSSTSGSVPTDSGSPYAVGSAVTVLGNTGTLARTGYTFAGWNTAANGSGTSYTPGNSFTILSNTTLYAQWPPNATYAVTYDGNGSTGGTPPSDANSPYVSGATVTVLNNPGGLVKSGYSFANWNTAANGSGSSYTAGNSFTITSNTTFYAQWTASPNISVSSGTLTFSPVAVNGTSASLTYTIAGANLTSDLTITAPAGFQISTNSGAGFGNSLTLVKTNGTVAATTIYVQFQPVALQYYSGQITNLSAGANEPDVTVTGFGANAPSVSTLAAGGVATNGAVLNGSVVASNNATITDRGFYYKTSAGVTTADTQVDEGGTSVAAFSSALTGLSANQTYYYRAYAMNAIGRTLDASESSFTTLANTPVAPTIGSPSQTSLNVTIGTGDGNPTATVYAIKETGSGNYVQANGTLGAAAVYQTAATWGSVTVSGLVHSTSYSFQVKAQNSLGTDTAFGTAATASTAAAPFTAGNLAVLSVDSASANNSSFSILELSPGVHQSSPVQMVAINGTSGGSALRTSGSSTSTGYLSDSDDGTLVVFGAHNTASSAGNINTFTARGVGALSPAATFSLTATYTGTNGNQVRGATTINKNTWFVADQGGVYTNGSAGLTTGVNPRAIKSFGGTLYLLQQSASAVVISMVSAAGTTATPLPGLSTDNKANDFYLISSGNNGSLFDVLYTVG
ncbi:MAG TPA: InlB B-repeat-containing protein, partial [Verrucomicrobiae bacterium]